MSCLCSNLTTPQIEAMAACAAPEMDDTIISMYVGGANYQDIAASIGRSECVAARACNRLIRQHRMKRRADIRNTGGMKRRFA